MKRGYFSLILPILLMVSGFSMRPPQQVKTTDKAVQEAAESWLRLIDSGKYAESWDELAEAMKAKITKESWEKLRDSVARPVNAEAGKSRTLTRSISVPSLPSLPDQVGMRLEYQAPNDEHHSEMEMVELVLEGVRGWRVVNYVRISIAYLYRPSFAPPPPPAAYGSLRFEPANRDDQPTGDPKGVPGPPSPGGSGSGASSGVDQKPVLLNRPMPSYTQAARDDKVEGAIMLRVLVDPDGSVKQVRVVRGLPDGLDEQAVKAAYQMRFRPAMKDGKPVAYWVSTQVEFNLGN